MRSPLSARSPVIAALSAKHDVPCEYLRVFIAHDKRVYRGAIKAGWPELVLTWIVVI